MEVATERPPSYGQVPSVSSSLSEFNEVSVNFWMALSAQRIVDHLLSLSRSIITIKLSVQVSLYLFIFFPRLPPPHYTDDIRQRWHLTEHKCYTLCMHT